MKNVVISDDVSVRSWMVKNPDMADVSIFTSASLTCTLYCCRPDSWKPVNLALDFRKDEENEDVRGGTYGGIGILV